MEFFKPYLRKKLSFNWKFGLFLIIAFGAPRFFAVLNASKTGDYRFTSIIFAVMWILPFVLLTKHGRREIGVKKPKNYRSLLSALILGGVICIAIGLLGKWLYGDSLQNWFVYISKSYQLPASDQSFEALRFKYFLIFGLMSMIFSPIGEELLYRGLIHRCFSEKLGVSKASLVDSLAFGITHLAHFGILFVDGSWEFHLIPALLWVTLMFLASKVFFYTKQFSNSLLGAIVCHAGFNLAMTYFIFYHIL